VVAHHQAFPAAAAAAADAAGGLCPSLSYPMTLTASTDL